MYHDSDGEGFDAFATMPRFSGGRTENIDDFIDRVNVIMEHPGATERDLMFKLIDSTFTGSAKIWAFNLMGPRGRRPRTWADWQTALHDGFDLPDHKARMRVRCFYRTLQRDESLADYYYSKRRLQKYVFPENAPQAVLVADLMDGLPQELVMLIERQSRITSEMTMDKVRSIMKDSAINAIRQQIVPDDWYDDCSVKTSNLMGSDNSGRPDNRQPARNTYPKRPNRSRKHRGPPPSACKNCGGDHWRNGCTEPAPGR
jgi:hypothetical protein